MNESKPRPEAQISDDSPPSRPVLGDEKGAARQAWRRLLQDKVTRRQTFFTINEGYLLNNFLPLRLGEVGRAYLLGQNSGLGFWRVLSSILLERGLDVLLTVAMLLGALPFVT